jgi:hypothetical protein
MIRKLFIWLMLICLFTSCADKKKTNWNVGLQREGKQPYDLYLGYHSLGYYYPMAGFMVLNGSTALETLPQVDRDGKAMAVLVGKSIDFNYAERAALLDFVADGNELVLCSGAIDRELLRRFSLREVGGGESIPLSYANPGKANKDALSLTILPGKRFGIEGRNLRGSFYITDSADTAISVLGKVRDAGAELPYICRVPHKEGHITFVASPLILSNYFLLQPSNREYIGAFWQQIGYHFDMIYWGNYQHRNPELSGWNLLMRHPAVRAAVLLAILLMVVYLLVESRRKQRQIPEIKPVENSYASFVETVGMLYFNHHDNANLCHKLEQHFLEWVRSRFRLSTEVLDEEFVQLLSGKSGVDRDHTARLIGMIHELRTTTDWVSDSFLFEFYAAIHVFYTINAPNGNRI